MVDIPTANFKSDFQVEVVKNVLLELTGDHVERKHKTASKVPEPMYCSYSATFNGNSTYRTNNSIPALPSSQNGIYVVGSISFRPDQL